MKERIAYLIVLSGQDSICGSNHFTWKGGCTTAKYFALHTLKKSGEEVSNALNHGAAEIAQAMASGETPAVCLRTWSPIPHGREDYLLCIWEGNSAKEVEATIGSFGLLEYSALDAMQVDEIDREQLAKAVRLRWAPRWPTGTELKYGRG